MHTYPSGIDSVAAHGNASIKKGSKSFALASRVLPPSLRDDAAMLYAWCPYCDYVMDGQGMGHGQIADYKHGQGERLEMLRAKTRAVLAGGPTDDPVFAGLARAVKTHEIDHHHPMDLLKDFEMDAEERVYNSNALTGRTNGPLLQKPSPQSVQLAEVKCTRLRVKQICHLPFGIPSGRQLCGHVLLKNRTLADPNVETIVSTGAAYEPAWLQTAAKIINLAQRHAIVAQNIINRCHMKIDIRQCEP